MALYHGTTENAAKSMLANGVDLDHPCKADPGDFGLGFYLTTSIHRAQSFGHQVLVAEINTTSYATIKCPYKPHDGTTISNLFKSLAFNDKDDMLTCFHSVSKEERKEVCTRIRQEFLNHGYKGIVSDHNGEVVVFDISTIKKLEIFRRQDC